MKILVLNAGSSSLKAELYEIGSGAPTDDAPEASWELRADWGSHSGEADLTIKAAGETTEQTKKIDSPAAVFDVALEAVPDRASLDVVGHRIVHGGAAFREPSRITPEAKAEIAKVAEFAPAHNKIELAAIEAVERIIGPQVPQVAVFDTAFHATLAPPAYVYPGPYEWLAQGIRRYGFHGISHQYTSHRAAAILGKPLESVRMVTCHLGNGCSLAAIRDGHSVDTTMGFTPLEGLMMGSRSGSVDPGILLHLLKRGEHAADDLDRVLNQESGLKGISGVSSDMRQILAAIDNGNQRAKLAFDIFVHRLQSEIGSMVASLGGLDVLVFTGGIGENAAPVRAAVCEGMGYLGVQLDSALNADKLVGDVVISQAESPTRLLVIKTREEWQIALACQRLMVSFSKNSTLSA